MNDTIISIHRYTTAVFIGISILFVCGPSVSAQVDEKRFEIGGQFSVLRRSVPVFPRGPGHPPSFPREFEFEGAVRYGFGGRLTYNLNKYVAVEGEGNVFIEDDDGLFSETGGTFYQGQFGVKAGKRFSKFGIFAKARPGLVHLRRELISRVTVIGGGNGTGVIFSLSSEPATHFSADLGGVLEFYPSKRIMARVDVGDTIINFPGEAPLPVLPPGSFISGRPAAKKHNLQVSLGMGYRF